MKYYVIEIMNDRVLINELEVIKEGANRLELRTNIKDSVNFKYVVDKRDLNKMDKLKKRVITNDLKLGKVEFNKLVSSLVNDYLKGIKEHMQMFL